MTRHYSYGRAFGGELLEVSCAVCGGDETRELGVDNGFRVVKCTAANCGFVFVNPRPTRGQLNELYQEYYPRDPDTAEAWGREMADVVDECREILLSHAERGDLLDVGCSFGHLLKAMEEAGWNVSGVEPSPVAAEIARRVTDATIHEGAFEDVQLRRESYDAVVSLYVLEHVCDPRAFLQRIHDMLGESGLAIIRIPHTEPLMPIQRALGRPLLQAPMHLNDFSPQSFTRLARSVGFADVQCRIGRLRRSSDRVERLGSLILGGTARVLERVSGGRVLFPFSGAKTYLAWR